MLKLKQLELSLLYIVESTFLCIYSDKTGVENLAVFYQSRLHSRLKTTSLDSIYQL